MNATSRRIHFAILALAGVILFCGVVAFVTAGASGMEARPLGAADLKARFGGQTQAIKCHSDGLCVGVTRECPATCPTLNVKCMSGGESVTKLEYKNPLDCKSGGDGAVCTPGAGPVSAICRIQTACWCRPFGPVIKECVADGFVDNAPRTLNTPTAQNGTCPWTPMP